MVIGIMDSGMGGLNLLASLIKYHCGEKFVYYADNANLPFGEKSPNELKNIALAGAEKLMEKGANVIIFGCNTLSAVALDHVRKRVKPPVFGLLPRPELLYGRALMLCTPATALYLPALEANVSLLTPAHLASLIEADHPENRRIERYLSPLLSPYADCESVYLGCSHYLFAKEVIIRHIPHAKMLSGVDPLAALVKAVLPINECKTPTVELMFSAQNQSERYYRLLQCLLA